MRIMDDALELMKREFAARMEEVARKEAKLAVEKAALDGMVEKFRDFIQENDAKKEKALAKAAEEEDAIRKLLAEEASWEQQMDEARRRRQALADMTREAARRGPTAGGRPARGAPCAAAAAPRAALPCPSRQSADLRRPPPLPKPPPAESLTPYYTFLAVVVADPSTEFSDTGDMLGRYARLDTTHGAQDSTVRRKKEAVAEVRRRITGATAEGETRQLELSSRIETGRKRLEGLVEVGRELADQRAGADDAARRLIVEESQVRMSVVNLFGRCRDSVLLTAGGGRAETAAGSGLAAASASGAKTKKATAKLLTQMHVAPPADDSRAELQRHLEDTLDVVGHRMVDLVELDRRYPGWVVSGHRASRGRAPPLPAAFPPPPFGPHLLHRRIARRARPGRPRRGLQSCVSRTWWRSRPRSVRWRGRVSGWPTSGSSGAARRTTR